MSAFADMAQSFSIVHIASGRFLDALQDAKDDSMIEFDFNVVIRPRQDNDRQHWLMIKEPNTGLFRIQQVSSGRFLDAHEISDKDFRVVTRPRQENNTQLWSMNVIDAHNSFTLKQDSSGRLLDARLSEEFNFQVVTRSEKPDFNGQLWTFPGLD